MERTGAEVYEYEILPRLDRAAILTELKPKARGNYIALNCPSCGKPEAFIYQTGTPRIVCNRRNECRYSRSLWDYIQESKGLDQQGTLKYLADFVGIQLPERARLSPEEIEEQHKRADIMEAAQALFIRSIGTSAGKCAFDYLTGRGIKKEEIEQWGIGFFPPRGLFLQEMSAGGYAEADIQSAGLDTQGFGDSHIVTIPYRSAGGALQGFIVRNLTGGTGKYKYTRGISLKSPFLLNEARPRERLIVMEGYIDALLARSRGATYPVVSVGRADLTRDQARAFALCGVKEAYLCLDSDKAGTEGMDRSIETLRGAGIRAYAVSLPALPGQEKTDPDIFIRSSGIQAFNSLVERPLSGAEYRARRILSRHDITTQPGRDRAKEELIALADSCRDYFGAKDVLDLAVSSLGLPPDIMEAEIKAFQEKQTKEAQRETWSRLARDLQDALRDGGSPEKARELVEDAMQAGRGALIGAFPPPFGADTYGEHLRKKEDAGYKTGYSTLDKLVTIRPGALTLIGGRPGHGKTSFMLNILVNMLRNPAYNGKTVFFFTYEEPAGDLTTKILNLFAGEVIEEQSNNDKIEAYFRRGEKSRDRLNKAYTEFMGYVNTSRPRLYIVNEPYCAEDLIEHLSALAGKYDIGPVFLDYIQKVRPKRGDHYSRQTEIQYVSSLILNEGAIRNNVPIIAGAQLNRTANIEGALSLDQFREAGDLEQDANTALFVWNKKKELSQLREIIETLPENDKKRQYQGILDKAGDLKAGAIPFNVHIMKNRGGPEGERVEMIFNAPVLKIAERSIQEDLSGF